MNCRVASILLLLLLAPNPLPAEPSSAPTSASVLAASSASDWRPLDPANTLVMELASGRVIIELAPAFAPAHVANLRRLASGHYWDDLAIVRVQDNYVVQWADPHADSPAQARSLGDAAAALPAEFFRAAKGLAFDRLPEGDVYAAQVGWSGGFPAARTSATGEAWLAHCYGTVGAGRGNAADSSNGSQLYAVIGHAPRHLDRNITVVGRVVQGLALLSALPRGTGPLGFYEDDGEHVPIGTVRLASDLPAGSRVALEVLRTDTATFRQWVESRRNRREDWFIEPVGTVELCNVPIPVRSVASGAP